MNGELTPALLDHHYVHKISLSPLIRQFWWLIPVVVQVKLVILAVNDARKMQRAKDTRKEQHSY